MVSEELMPIVWYSKRLWNFYMSEDEKKRNRIDFYWVMLFCIQFESIGTFWHLKSLWISSHFDIIQSFFFFDSFLGHLSQNIYLKQFSTEKLYMKTCYNFLC